MLTESKPTIGNQQNKSAEYAQIKQKEALLKMNNTITKILDTVNGASEKMNKITRTDFYDVMQRNTDSIPYMLNSFIDKYWKAGDINLILKNYSKAIVKTSKLSFSDKQEVFVKLKKLLMITTDEYKDRKSVSKDERNTVETNKLGVYEHISSKLNELDSREFSLEKFHQYVTSEKPFLLKNPDGLKKLLSGLSYRNEYYTGVLDLYNDRRKRILKRGDITTLNEVDRIMLQYIQDMGLGLKVEHTAVTEIPSIRAKIDPADIILDFENYITSNINLEKEEKLVTDNITGLIDKDQLLVNVYEKYAQSLADTKDFDRLKVLNKVMEDYTANSYRGVESSKQVESLSKKVIPNRITKVADTIDDSFSAWDRDELIAKRSSLVEYINSFDDLSRYAASVKIRKSELLQEAKKQLEQIDGILYPEDK